MSTTVKVQITHELSLQDVANIMITAFEGGISYWCPSAQAVELTASGWQQLVGQRYDEQRIDGCGPYANPSFWDKTDIKRGYILFHDPDEEGHFQKIERVVTVNRIGSAITKLNQINPEVAMRIVTEQYDANDADVLIQVAAFEEVVYG